MFDDYQQDRERAELFVDVMHSICNDLNVDAIIASVVRILSVHVNAQHVVFYSVTRDSENTGTSFSEKFSELSKVYLECKVFFLSYCSYILGNKSSCFSSRLPRIFISPW